MLRILFSLYLGLIWAVMSGSGVLARQSLPLETGKVVASLVSDHDTVAPGQDFYIALRTELDDHWHTYWRNPGDSGEPVQMQWDLPDGVIGGEGVKSIIWPLPRPIATGPIINYGFEGAPLFPVKFTVPASTAPGDILTFTSNFYYLVCKDVCIPEDGSLSLQIKVGAPEVDTRWDADIRRAIAQSPKPGGATGTIRKEADVLITQFAKLPDGDFAEAYFFPYAQGVLMHSDPQAVNVGANGIEISTRPDYAWDSDLPESFDGILTYMDGGAYRGTEVSLRVGETINVGLGGAASSPSQPKVTLISAILGAMLGGLILNLMPCVFPIISLKALSLSKAAHSERGAARRHAWLYTAGVLATFAVLIGVLLALKATGQALGWGFQLQSPKVTGVLALLMFVIGLNLLGMFEFGTALQNTGQGLTTQSGPSGSFFTGALAVIVATPCTAPFMGVAMGYALAQPAGITILVFLALGLGFAAPFLLLGYAPQLLAKLPKPGPWMARFKEFLAFPMFATAIWLAWVMGNQAGTTGLSFLLIAALLVGFGIWLWQRGTLGKALGTLAVLAAIALPLTLSTAPVQAVQATGKADTLVWSPAAVAEARAQGRPVFVDFTADWCVTCKVNERLVINTEKTRKLFKDTNTAFFVADWTNKNDAIAQELAAYGRAGVPLYLAYAADQESVKAQILPQVLTYNVLQDAIRGSN